MINPATGLEDPNYKTPVSNQIWWVPVWTADPNKIWRDFAPPAPVSPYKPLETTQNAQWTNIWVILWWAFPAPTVATPTSPLVDKETIGVKPEEPIVLNRDNFVNIIGKDPTKLTEKEKELIRKVQGRRAMWEELYTIFWEPAPTTTTWTAPVPTAPLTAWDITTRKGELATATADLVTKKQAELDANLAKRKSELEALWEKQKAAAQTVLSTSWFGRSTVSATQQADIQKNTNDMVAAEQARAAQELAIFKAQQEWADAETIGGMQKTLNDYNFKVQELEFNTANEIAKTNATNKIKGQEALDNFLTALTTKTKEQLASEWYDKDLSAKLGYAVDKFWKPLMVDGKKLEFAEAWISDAVESYASEIFKGNANISSVPDEQRDAVINRVAGMRNENKTSTSSLNEFKAERILKTVLKRTIDKQKDAAYMWFVWNMLDQWMTEDEIYSELWAADLKKTDFVTWNQKLFDDMQKDAKTFTDVKYSYNNAKSLIAQYKEWKITPWVLDTALTYTFMKMLDPGSVVRESEFALIAANQWLIDRLFATAKSAVEWGTKIDDKTRQSMVDASWTLFKAYEDWMRKRGQAYEEIASDLWGDPNFVKRFLWKEVQNSENNSKIDSILNETFSDSKIESGWMKFNIKPFNIPGQSGWTTGLKDLTSERGKSIPYTGNVWKDLNNPWNLTAGWWADKFASWYVTVTGNDWVTRKFLTFANKDAWYEWVKADLQAKISWGSRYVKPTDTLWKLLDVWVWWKWAWSGYKWRVAQTSWYNLNTPIKWLDVNKILNWIKIAEWA